MSINCKEQFDAVVNLHFNMFASVPI